MQDFGAKSSWATDRNCKFDVIKMGKPIIPETAEALPKETSLETLLPMDTMLNRCDIRLEVSL